MIVGGYRIGTLLRKTGQEILNDGILSLAAQTAYYFFFSLFPLLLFAAPLLSLFGNGPSTVTWLMQQLGAVVPPDAMQLVRGVVEDVVLSPNAPGLMSVGALLAAWAGSNVFTALIDALNRAYDVDEGRPWWKKRLVALAAVLATGILMLITSTVMLAGPEIADWLARHTALAAPALWRVIQYTLAFLLLVAALWLVYFFLPAQRQDGKQVVIGALVAAVLWVIVTLGFRFYVSHFGSYNKTYGTIGGVIILLTWMYLTMLVVLAGGELNSELHHGTGAVHPRRGAVYEGRIVTTADPDHASTDRIERLAPTMRRPA
ncbi:MAG TPA: YihY/virulence factor BrkB family protein [Gemmatimonadaceae bacterium]|nr:YihY/virulence factor BrkB family protein [Gemmatimonadaceae bacterium]